MPQMVEPCYKCGKVVYYVVVQNTAERFRDYVVDGLVNKLADLIRCA